MEPVLAALIASTVALAIGVAVLAWDRRPAAEREADRAELLGAIATHASGDLTRHTDLAMMGLISRPLRRARARYESPGPKAVLMALQDIAELKRRGLLRQETIERKLEDGTTKTKLSQMVYITEDGIEAAAAGTTRKVTKPPQTHNYTALGPMQVNHDGTSATQNNVDASVGKVQLINEIEALLDTIWDRAAPEDKADAEHFARQAHSAAVSDPPSQRRWDAAVHALQQIALGTAGNGAWEALKTYGPRLFG